MKLSTYSADQVYSLLEGIETPKHLHSKPTGLEQDEYIVVNSLPVPAGVMQGTYVNVNCHAKDIRATNMTGIPNRSKIDAMANAALSILEKVTLTDMLVDFEKSELFREEQFDEHYMNLRFKVNIINY
jgi:hypothetical protein